MKFNRTPLTCVHVQFLILKKLCYDISKSNPNKQKNIDFLLQKVNNLHGENFCYNKGSSVWSQSKP